ncbi:MAG: hypothetical protein PUK18_02525 [Firmicutes bacterium]|nr:hypothetical protein [Bacillota bacterium]MDY6159315.1 Cas9 inhibitor AcrIIA9 family protein [Candidatus Faecousia sp.]
MELIKPRKYGEMAAEKIAKELKEFKGDRYGDAVKDFVASTLTNFCEQNERFAQVVYETEATLSDCCSKIMKNCGNHISDIDVYRGAVRYYFPNAEVHFTMTIDASGDMPTPEEMAKPGPKTETTERKATKAERVPKGSAKPAKQEKPKVAEQEKKKPAAQAPVAPEKKPIPKPKKESKPKNPAKDDGLIQLSLF